MIASPAVASRWIGIARYGWIALALAYLAVFVASFPAAYEANRSLCDGMECGISQLTSHEVDTLVELGFTHRDYATLETAIEALLLAWGVLGVFIFVRRPTEWMATLVSMALIALGMNGFSNNVTLLAKQTPQLNPLYNSLSAISIALGILLLFLFPDGKFVPTWTRYLAVPMVAMALADPLLAFVLPTMENAPGTRVALVVLVAAIASGVVGQIYRYQNHSDLEQRQQSKWVVYGFLGMAIVALIWTLFIELFPLAPGPQRLAFIIVARPTITLLILAVPLTMTFSILRYRLFAIDVIIKRTLVYGSLTAVIVLVYFVAVVVFQSALSGVTGQGDQLAIVASTLLIAALFTPLRRRIQSGVDRRFFRADYDTAQALASFGEAAREHVDLEVMQRTLVNIVQTTMHPSSLSLWMREEIEPPRRGYQLQEDTK